MSDNTVINVTFAGIGGQGVLKASDILADAAFRAGYDVKKSEIHGMSQRGGSVTSDVRIGKSVLSPMVPPGEADFLVVLAPEEIEANRHRLAQPAQCCEDNSCCARSAGGVLIDTSIISEDQLEDKRSLNVFLLGALSAHVDIAGEHWLAAIRAALPAKVHEVNERAFAAGRLAAGSI